MSRRRTVASDRSFLNWPLEMSRVPRVRRPSSASFPCCFAVFLSTGALGRAALLPPRCSACQMKSWRRLPSFLVSSRILACSMTLLRSVIRCWPSLDSFLDGELRALCASAELSATSICWLEGTFPLEKASCGQRLFAFGCATRGDVGAPLLALLTLEDAVKL
jgi:hypothetical protein